MKVYSDFRVLVRRRCIDVEPEEKSLGELAQEYVGAHCMRRCRFCRLDPSECKYIQDENTFLAGAKALGTRIKDMVEEFLEKTDDLILPPDVKDLCFKLTTEIKSNL